MIKKLRIMKGTNKKKILALTFIFSSLLVLASTQFPPWDVPAEANDLENPITVDKKNLDAGKTFFDLSCKACHGATGLGDGAVPSGDFTTKAFTAQTDGAIFWKIQQGRGLMPSFKAMPETSLWQAIIYIRTLATPQEVVAMKNASIVIEFDESNNKKLVTAKVYEILENGEQTPAKEVRVNFFIKRYFADMLIGGSNNYTDENGNVSISFPEGVPGKEGKLQVMAKLDDSGFNPAVLTEEVAWGVEKAAYWNDNRQLWKNNDFVPLWLLITFFGVIGGILIAILYVLLQVVKIRKLGVGR
ncbi:MAG: hypothetical protein DRI83_00480 [Bacteroidetes bacterium]|nr:MAG: hypothetical protein DRI83_00480 [Bacteroidota bacterium]